MVPGEWEMVGAQLMKLTKQSQWASTTSVGSMSLFLLFHACCIPPDTAQLYGNEKEVGIAIKESGLSRQDIFITTKYSHIHQVSTDILASIKDSLRYVCLHIHPQGFQVTENFVAGCRPRRSIPHPLPISCGPGYPYFLEIPRRL